jgi:FkbM family methyltransferase
VGAHIGKYTVTVARKMQDKGRVIAIEPEPVNFSLLSQNVVLNHLNNVILQNIACSDRNGKADLYVHKDRPTLHSFYINMGLMKIEVNTVTLDTLIQRLKLDRVDLIKIDVEAAEIDVFKGAVSVLQSYHPQIIFEAYDESVLNQIKQIISNFDYNVKKIDGKNYHAY